MLASSVILEERSINVSLTLIAIAALDRLNPISVAISKRARQLLDGDKPLVDHVPGKPFNAVSLAIKEFSEGKIDLSIKEEVDEELELLEKLDKGLEAKLEQEVSDAPVEAKKDKKPKSKAASTS